MGEEVDRIQQDIARTKAELAEKLSAFETELRDDVSSVEGAIRNVKMTARKLSVNYHVRENPLLMVGGSALTGFLMTRWLAGPPSHQDSLPESSRQPSLVSRVAEQFPDEVQAIKSLAVRYAVGYLAEKARTELPHLIKEIGVVERHLKSKVGEPGELPGANETEEQG